MLISPLMGPIMGLGLSVGINDLPLLRKSFYNYMVATGVALATSTFFFLLSPLNEAHSEILARTSPTIYDVLIALFGGFAGIIATASKHKGNVIPGVAIATALMPPLCTAGYGLATLKLSFFVGAFYLFIINTVFIALATFLTSRFLQLPYKHFPDKRSDVRAKRIIWLVVFLTIIPSLYFGYDMVQQNGFRKKADSFISAEGNFPNDYLLNKKIDPKNRLITLVYGGDVISAAAIDNLKLKMKNFGLEKTELQVHQGFAYLSATNTADEHKEQTDRLSLLLEDKDRRMRLLQTKIDSLLSYTRLSQQLYQELKVQHTGLQEAIVGTGKKESSDSTSKPIGLVVLNFSQRKSALEKSKIEKWLRVRLGRNDLKVIIE